MNEGIRNSLVYMEMTQRHRLGDIASCGGEGGCGENESGIDRFSDLPDHVAHHILSFLALPDLSRVCCVSKRCGELCISAPKLNFDEFSPDTMSTCGGRLSLLTYLERFLFRHGDNKIQSFRVHWRRHHMDEDATPCICDNEHYRLCTWIQNAVRCNVEVLDLKMTLRSLMVDMNYTVLRTPTLAVSSNLKYLQLRNVYIEGDFFKWISCSCKCIEDLHLGQIHGVERITILRSSLKTFSFICYSLYDISHISISSEKLVDLSLAWEFDSPSNISLNIDAPNLTCFKLMGNMMKYPNLGKLECLKLAAVFLEPEVDNLDTVNEFLWSLRKVPVLMLNEVAIKASYMDGSVPASLYNTSCLSMHIKSFVDELVPVLVCVLRRMPNLSSLRIHCEPPQDPQSNTFGFKMKYWKLQDLACTNQLKHVYLELSSGSNGIEFAKYMLKYAPNMQRMVVICLPVDLEEVTLKLKKIKKISKSVLVIQKK